MWLSGLSGCFEEENISCLVVNTWFLRGNLRIVASKVYATQTSEPAVPASEAPLDHVPK